MRFFCRNRNLPPNNAGQSSRKLGSLVNHLNRVDNKYINILGELECILVSTMEKASKLCARKMKLHMYENNPAKQIMTHCGTVLTLIGRLRVDFKNESLLNSAEQELLSLEKEAYKLASHRNCCITAEGIHIITDTGICIALLGRLRRAQLKYDPEDDLPEAVCMCNYTEGCGGHGCGGPRPNLRPEPSHPAPYQPVSTPQPTGCRNCTCGCNNGCGNGCGNGCNALFTLCNKKLVFRHECSHVVSCDDTTPIPKDDAIAEAVADIVATAEEITMPAEFIVNEESVESVKPVPKPVVIVDDDVEQKIEKACSCVVCCPACCSGN